MALPKVSPGLLPAENYRRFNFAFDNIDSARTTIDVLVTQLAQVAANLVGEANTRASTDANITSTVADLTRRLVEEAGNRSKTDSDLVKTAQDLAARISSETAARIAGDADTPALKASLAAIKAITDEITSTVISGRPGEAPGRFTIVSDLLQLGGRRDLLPAISTAALADSDNGPVVRVRGAAIVAARNAFALELGRLYRVRCVVQRRTNSPDPFNDAVVLAVVYLDQSLRVLQPHAALQTITLTTAAGRQEREALLSRTVGQGGAVIAPPAARFAVPVVIFYGAGHVSDVEALSHDDVTGAFLLPPPAADLEARVSAIESGDFGGRVEILEQEASTPAKVTFKTKGDAVAGSIPAVVQVVELLGRDQAGDGGAGRYVRTSGAPGPDADSFTSGGAVFVRETTAADIASAFMAAGYAALLAGPTAFGIFLSDLDRWRGRSALSPKDFGAVSHERGDIICTAEIREMIAEAQASGRAIHWDGIYGIDDTITIPAKIPQTAAADAVIVSKGAVNGIVLAPGNAQGKIELPILQNFPGIALTVRSNLARVKVEQILGCGTCVQFLASEGNAVLDSIVDLNAASVCGTVVSFKGDDPARVIQGCGVNYNFITHTANPVKFEGANCFNDGLFLRGEAIDMTPEYPNGVVLQNDLSVAVPRFTLEVRSWFGGEGLAAGAKFATGVWENGLIDLCDANGVRLSNLGPNVLRGTRIRTRGINAVPYTISQTAGLANFNGGTELMGTHVTLRGTMNADLQPNAVTDFYFYSVWSQDFNYRGMWHGTLLDAPVGLVLQTISDDSPAELGRTRIRVINLGPNAISLNATFAVIATRAF